MVTGLVVVVTGVVVTGVVVTGVVVTVEVGAVVLLATAVVIFSVFDVPNVTSAQLNPIIEDNAINTQKCFIFHTQFCKPTKETINYY